ncbi:MAG: tRNA 2-thiouridine(34) synthase MnmA [bacterium]
MLKNFTQNKKILVAMSGGVDSSVVAATLKEAGHDVIGVTMSLYCTTNASDRSCCSAEAANDAKKVADKLGIPHYVLNFKADFEKTVIQDFIAEYKAGRTPNPCIRCNQFLKFDHLLAKARELGAEYIATGHYARVGVRGKGIEGSKKIYSAPYSLPPNPLTLLKGLDSRKDQSYVLYRLTQEQLAQTLFPLGEMTKDEVRKLAKKYKLPVAEKKESQEICFIADDDYGRFLKEKIPAVVKPGDIVDKTGKVVGRHEGIVFYTIGQRKGIGAHRGEPKYVISLDAKNNKVVIGDNDDLLRRELIADQVSFISGEWPAGALEVGAKIRYNSKEAPAVITPLSVGKMKVEFKGPQRAVTPGQSVVFYEGEEVLGGGLIS